MGIIKDYNKWYVQMVNSNPHSYAIVREDHFVSWYILRYGKEPLRIKKKDFMAACKSYTKYLTDYLRSL